MTTDPTTDPTHGLSVQHADALWDAVAIPGPRTPTFPEQHERVCRAVAGILAEVTAAREELPVPAVVLPPAPRTDEAQSADRAALRDRIAEVLTEAYLTAPEDSSIMDHCANAVLAVLPAPADRATDFTAAADTAEGIAVRLHREGATERSQGAYDVMDVLRKAARMVGEAQPAAVASVDRAAVFRAEADVLEREMEACATVDNCPPCQSKATVVRHLRAVVVEAHPASPSACPRGGV